jgi:hypothetical protein
MFSSIIFDGNAASSRVPLRKIQHDWNSERVSGAVGAAKSLCVCDACKSNVFRDDITPLDGLIEQG